MVAIIPTRERTTPIIVSACNGVYIGDGIQSLSLEQISWIYQVNNTVRYTCIVCIIMTDVHVVHNPYFKTSLQLMLDVHVPIFDLPMDNVEVTQCKSP